MVETKDKGISAVFIFVKGKKDGEMLLGCDTAMELDVLKIVKSVEKEETMLRPAVAVHHLRVLANINTQKTRSTFTKPFSQSHK